MPTAAMAMKGLGTHVIISRSPRQIVSRPLQRQALVLSASKDGHGLLVERVSSYQLGQTVRTCLKTSLMAGACFFVGFGSGSAHAARKVPPPTPEIATVAVVEQQSPVPTAAGGGSAGAVVDWQQFAKDVQASPYTIPVVVVVLLVAGVSLLGGGSKKEAASRSTSTSTSEPPKESALQQPAAKELAAVTVEPAVEPAPAPSPSLAAPVVVTARPMTVSANPFMASQPVRPPPATVAAAAPPSPPPAVPAAPAPPPPPPPPVPAPVAAAPAPAAAPPPAQAPDLPAAPASVDSRPSAREWIANWRESQPPKPAPSVLAAVTVTPEPAPAIAPTTVAPEPAVPPPATSTVLPVDSRPSAKEWIAQWRASQPPRQQVPAPDPLATEVEKLAPAPTPAVAAAPEPVPAAPVFEEATPAVVAPAPASTREKMLSAAELAKLSGSQPDVVSSAARSTPVVAKDEYVVFKFPEGGAPVTAQPISVLQPPAVQPSVSMAATATAVVAGNKAFDSSVSTDDNDEPPLAPPPASKSTVATVAAARVVQGPAPTPSGSASSAMSNGHRSPARSAPSTSNGVGKESLGAAARDPIVMTAAVVVGAARQMKGFGTFVSDGLMPAMGALLGGASSNSKQQDGR